MIMLQELAGTIIFVMILLVSLAVVMIVAYGDVSWLFGAILIDIHLAPVAWVLWDIGESFDDK